MAFADSGAPRWHHDLEEGDVAAAGMSIDVTSDGGEQVRVRASVPATMWTLKGESTELSAGEPIPWPRGGRLVLASSDLRLRRPLLEEEVGLNDEPEWLAAVPEGAHLTVDDDLQSAADRILEAELERLPADDGDTVGLRGAVLVMDGRTGDILACVFRNREGVDPDSVVAQPCWQDSGIHPGSTFKIATSIAALRTPDPVVRAMLLGELPPGLKAGGPRSTLLGAKLPRTAGGRTPVIRSRLKNHKSHTMPTDATLEDALRSSYNVWFGYMGLLLHQPIRQGWGDSGIASESARVDAWPVAAVARKVGFDERIDLGAGLVGTAGHVPMDAASDAAVAARSIGQDAVTATPLGVAMLVATASEGGRAPRPRIGFDREVESVEVLDAASAARLRTALGQVVMKGTAARAFSDNPWRERIIGKTGSSQRIDGAGLDRTDAWFGGAMLPPEGSDDSSVVIVCVLPGGGLGGRHAAEIVDNVSREVLRIRGWQE